MFERIVWNSKTRDFVLKSLLYFPVRRKRILFLCWNGQKYGCNPKAIADGLIKGDEGYEVAFAFEKPEKFIQYLTGGTKALTIGSLEYYHYLATARFVVSNVHVSSSLFPYKKKSQLYIFTGHGSFGIKKIEFDSADALPEEYMRMASLDTSRIDLFLSNASFRTKVLRSAYRYNGEVLECGIPRNDVFFSFTSDMVGDIKKQFVSDHIPHELNNIDNLRFLLYTPTFRAGGDRDVYGFDFNRVGEALHNRLGGNWYFLISSHPNMLGFYREVYDFSNDHIVDVAHEDLQQLMLFGDVLVTDYSSAEMDFMVLKKTVFQLCRDKEMYDRGFYIDPCDLPFPYAENDDELVSCIETFDSNAYQDALKEFDRNIIGIKDKGCATDSVIDWIKRHS